jgi:hypothetical protein
MMRRSFALLALIAALALPLLTPAPASAGTVGQCSGGYVGPVSIEEIQQIDPRPSTARAATKADLNHNGDVCYQQRAKRGLTFSDDDADFPF